jgi:Fe2+ transport system protein FeoA
MLSLGLTCGTEVRVVDKQSGRMIITVRDSRLGLGLEISDLIVCEPIVKRNL